MKKRIAFDGYDLTLMEHNETCCIYYATSISGRVLFFQLFRIWDNEIDLTKYKRHAQFTDIMQEFDKLTMRYRHRNRDKY